MPSMIWFILRRTIDQSDQSNKTKTTKWNGEVNEFINGTVIEIEEKNCNCGASCVPWQIVDLTAIFITNFTIKFHNDVAQVRCQRTASRDQFIRMPTIYRSYNEHKSPSPCVSLNSLEFHIDRPSNGLYIFYISAISSSTISFNRNRLNFFIRPTDATPIKRTTSISNRHRRCFVSSLSILNWLRRIWEIRVTRAPHCLRPSHKIWNSSISGGHFSISSQPNPIEINI